MGGMSHAAPRLPIVRQLPAGTSPVAVFQRLCHRPRSIWFDSSSSPTEELGRFSQELGRFSFLSADPVRWMAASVGDGDPWPQLQQWSRELPTTHVTGLPPFQGGLAGLIGYEAATWIESIAPARCNDLPTAALAIGLYDWTVAFDHARSEAWLISQGLGAANEADRVARAQHRADVVERWLAEPPTEAGTTSESRWESPTNIDPSSVGAGWPTAATRRAGVTSNFSGHAFREAVAEIVIRIRRGDSFQVNLAQRLLRPATDTSANLYLRLRQCNPAPFAGYLDAGDFQVVSSSPEGFLRVRGRRVETRPIKGTVARTGDPLQDAELAEQLLQSEKDRAENVMIVDLMRNDLSRVCEDNSVQVSQLCEVERYQHVQHLVSAVEGRLRGDADTVDLLRACFPGGSVTGAPKVEAMRTIAELEPHVRGPYCGSLGYISCGGSADFNILIRTITATGNAWQIPVGGGITARSDPAAEEAETWIKAAGMLEATDKPERQPSRTR